MAHGMFPGGSVDLIDFFVNRSVYVCGNARRAGVCMCVRACACARLSPSLFLLLPLTRCNKKMSESVATLDVTEYVFSETQIRTQRTHMHTNHTHTYLYTRIALPL